MDFDLLNFRALLHAREHIKRKKTQKRNRSPLRLASTYCAADLLDKLQGTMNNQNYDIVESSFLRKLS